eukprot:RCo002764
MNEAGAPAPMYQQHQQQPPQQIQPHGSIGLGTPQLELERQQEAQRDASILKQVQHYFSDQNLPMDYNILSHADEQCYVTLEYVMKGPRLQALTSDVERVKRLLQASNFMSVVTTPEGVVKVRRKRQLPR